MFVIKISPFKLTLDAAVTYICVIYLFRTHCIKNEYRPANWLSGEKEKGRQVGHLNEIWHVIPLKSN